MLDATRTEKGKKIDTTPLNTREILKQLVAHFRQNIHVKIFAESYYSSSDERSQTDIQVLSEDADDVEQQQLDDSAASPIVQFWLDRLLTLDKAPCNDEGIAGVILEWIRGYEESVRPIVFHSTGSDASPAFHPDCTYMLENYELIFSKILSRLATLPDDPKGIGLSLTLPSTPVIPSFSLQQQTLQRAIKIFSTDVTLLTVSARYDVEGRNTNDDKTNDLRRNVALPTLLKILANTLETMRLLFATKTVANKAVGNPKTRNEKSCLSDCYECLRRCSVTLLAFEVPEIDDDESVVRSASIMLSPHQLAPSLSSSTSSDDCQSTDLVIVRRMFQHVGYNCPCSIDVDDVFDVSKSKNSSSDFTDVRRYIDGPLGNDSSAYDDVDDQYWNELQSSLKKSVSLAGWVDPTLNKMTFPVVRSTWHTIANLLREVSREAKIPFREQDEEIACADISVPKCHRRQVDFVLRTLGGAGPMLRDTRAHFFGRDMHSMETLVKLRADEIAGGNDSFAPSVLVRMGRRVTKAPKKSGFDEAPYEQIPSRIAAALNAFYFLLLPGMSGGVDKHCEEQILNDVFPICAALVDSHSSFCCVLGAAGFIRVIEVLQPRKRGPGSTCTNEKAWINFSENALSVLDKASKASSDSGVLVAIGRAQAILLDVMVLQENEKKEEVRKQAITGETRNHFRLKRRAATRQWLANLERSLHRSTGTKRHSLDLLLGGVIPSLSQHALDEENGADGMEMGRLGLAALLPLTTNSMGFTEQPGGDVVGRKTQMASMVALINLMFAAHPVMPSHGGKIMSHLLATAADSAPGTDRSDDESQNSTGNLPTKDSIRNMAIVTAAIALVICGQRFAGEVLESIENHREQYQHELVAAVSEVRKLAHRLTASS